MNSSNKAILPIETSWTLSEGAVSSTRPRSVLGRIAIARGLMLRARMTRDTLNLACECFYDFMRVLRYSSTVSTGNSKEKLAALITMAYHSIEKGLALPAPRPGFGKEQVNVLISRLERYGAAFGFDENALVALNALHKYCAFNEGKGHRDRALLSSVEDLARYCPAVSPKIAAGGVKLVRREDFLNHARMDLTDFFSSRASVRQYADLKVDLEDIENAVGSARKTPSCCNRQSGRVWVLKDQPKIQKALDIQGGARGFKQEVPMVLVVTSDLACFQSDGERFQTWIDGGMFAMSLVYSLHSFGLVTCCLNWSKGRKTDKRFKQEFHIPPNETIIMLISVGHPKDEYAVAQSHRRPVSELMRVL